MLGDHIKIVSLTIHLSEDDPIKDLIRLTLAALMASEPAAASNRKRDKVVNVAEWIAFYLSTHLHTKVDHHTEVEAVDGYPQSVKVTSIYIYNPEAGLSAIVKYVQCSEVICHHDLLPNTIVLEEPDSSKVTGFLNSGNAKGYITTTREYLTRDVYSLFLVPLINKESRDWHYLSVVPLDGRKGKGIQVRVFNRDLTPQKDISYRLLSSVVRFDPSKHLVDGYADTLEEILIDLVEPLSPRETLAEGGQRVLSYIQTHDVMEHVIHDVKHRDNVVGILEISIKKNKTRPNKGNVALTLTISIEDEILNTIRVTSSSY